MADTPVFAQKPGCLRRGRAVGRKGRARRAICRPCVVFGLVGECLLNLPARAPPARTDPAYPHARATSPAVPNTHSYAHAPPTSAEIRGTAESAVRGFRRVRAGIQGDAPLPGVGPGELIQVEGGPGIPGGDEAADTEHELFEEVMRSRTEGCTILAWYMGMTITRKPTLGGG